MKKKEGRFRQWYEAKHKTYDGLRKLVEELLVRILDEEGLKKGDEYILIDSRLKEADSFQKKTETIERGQRKYCSPTDITDIAGIRIVASILSDRKKLFSLIERHFSIDHDKTVDEQKRLGEDRIGYRSKNYVATLNREILESSSHFTKFEGLWFEIQVKTILDFAWGEIEHDRNYKYAGEFPSGSHIPRRFKLVAGLLEIADNELDYISNQANRYNKTVLEKIKKGQFVEINPRSLRLYLTKRFAKISGFKPYFGFGVTDNILDELKSMGINSIGKLHQIIPKDFSQRHKKIAQTTNNESLSALTRQVLMIHNIQKYFNLAWKRHYNTIDYHTVEILNEFGIKLTRLPDGLEIGEPE
jgi:putative GTP pyrophosphokinase